jgi:hypothetical protein
MAVKTSVHHIRLNAPPAPLSLVYLLWEHYHTEKRRGEYRHLMDAMRWANMGTRHGYQASHVYELVDGWWLPLKNRSYNGAETEYVFELIFGEDSVIELTNDMKVFIDPKRLALVKLKSQFIDNRQPVK